MQDPRSPAPPSPPRYGSAPLPAARYVPGSGAPHPRARPKIGSGTLDREILLPSARWGEQAAYLHGVDLFNHAFFWEAHEAWEGLWARAEGTQRLFLQGLIQLAGALLKHDVQSAGGSLRLSRAARRRLAAVCEQEGLAPGARFMGMDVRALLQAIDAAFDPLVQAEPQEAVPPLGAPLVLALVGE
jgi:hypothetical protein